MMSNQATAPKEGPQGKALAPKKLIVKKVEDRSASIRRIWFDLSQVDDAAQDWAGRYIKLLFTPEGSTDISPLIAQGEAKLCQKRTYTLAALDTKTKVCAIDFVLHVCHANEIMTPETGGYGAHFALNAAPGDEIYFGGPGTLKPFETQDKFFLMFADLTAVPALVHQVSLLGDNPQGYVIISILDDSDKQHTAESLNLPQGLELKYVQDPSATQFASQIAEMNLALPEAQKLAVWCACEFSQMRAIRDLCRGIEDFNLRGHYFSSYWKTGLTEDGHKVVKRADAAELENQQA